MSLRFCMAFALMVVSNLYSMDRPNTPTPELERKSLDITNKFIMTPHDLGAVAIYYNNSKFKIAHEDKYHDVKDHNVDVSIRNATVHQLSRFLDNGYLSVKKQNDGQFIIKANVRGNGGLGVSAGYVYTGVKAACYATAGVALGAAAGTAAVAVGGGVAGAAIGVGGKAVVGAVLAAAPEAGLIAGGIVGAGGTAAATAATSAAVGVSGMGGGAVAISAAIETVALAAASVALACPYIP